LVQQSRIRKKCQESALSIDEVNPDEEVSVARFKELATRYIDEILEKGKQPIVVVGDRALY
jgi:tRNA A37 N6-isopentenylltransferase MiaA